MKGGTKKGPPRTGDEDRDRTASETVVTEGAAGLKRLKKAMRRILAVGRAPLDEKGRPSGP